MAKVDTDPQKIKGILSRGVHEIFTKNELKEKLLSGKKLNIKLGTDVTGSQLHLGHAVIHRKLRDLQELGHNVTLIIGDFTTLVGDHSDKVDMRKERNENEIKKDEETYKKQFYKTVLKDQTTIRHNSEWLKKLNFDDVIGLAEQFTVAQMLDRDTFIRRYKKKKPIGLDEFLYPLMQAYDSVALRCDLEMGGTDQTFNLLAGRKIMPTFGLKPQCAMVMNLLTGGDGKPMGKSLQNFIPVTDDPRNMYGKVMAIVDDVIFEYFELVTRIPTQEIEQMKTEIKRGANPMEYKKTLAKEVVVFYHSEKDAEKAQEYFEKTVQQKEMPSDLIVFEPKPNSTLLETIKLATGIESAGEIKRVIKQGGVEINGIKVADPNKIVENKSGDIIKYGKRTFAKVK